MHELRQLYIVTLIGLRAIPQRLGPSLVIVAGIAAVVAVTISILSMSAGFTRVINNSGRAERAIVLSQNSQFESASSIARDRLPAIASAPGVKTTVDGRPIFSAEYFAYVPVTKKDSGLDGWVVLRGVGPEAFALRPETKLISGRWFQRARHELIIGRSAQRQYQGLAERSQISLPEGNWTITGTFASNDGINESEMLADSETLMSALRASAFNSVTVLLTHPDSFSQFMTALTTDPTLAVDVVRETEYLHAQSKELNEFLAKIAYVVGGIMGLGALFGAFNTVYSAVSARSIEIATLRAIGFGPVAVAVSVLTEALLLSLAGAVLGATAAWIAFNGNLHSAGSVVFQLTVTPFLVGLGTGIACLLGLIGGLFPAIRAARLPVATALRAG
jgi:putative ABC transport system permease protein